MPNVELQDASEWQMTIEVRRNGKGQVTAHLVDARASLVAGADDPAHALLGLGDMLEKAVANLKAQAKPRAAA